jgi:hypothetical protein
MKSPGFLTLILSVLLLPACKKTETYRFSGQLLLSKKHPIPLSNRSIEIFQPGSAGIPFPIAKSPSDAASVTDGDGKFDFKFTTGTSMFIFFTGPNVSPLTFSTSAQDTSFPDFRRSNFPDSTYEAGKPIFIGKTIDTAIIKVELRSDLAATDTIGIEGYTINGIIKKEYTGRVGTAGSIILLDTVYNLLFTYYVGREKKFQNRFYGGRQFTTTYGYKYIAGSNTSPEFLSDADETKNEITVSFQK